MVTLDIKAFPGLTRYVWLLEPKLGEEHRLADVWAENVGELMDDRRTRRKQ